MNRTSYLPAALVAVILGAALFLQHRSYERALEQATFVSTNAAYANYMARNSAMNEARANFTQSQDLREAVRLLDQLARSYSESEPDQEGLRRRAELAKEARAFTGRFEPAAEQ